MKNLEWRAEFSTGLPEVDHEHRQLIGLINGALERSTGADASGPEVMAALGEIHARTTAHFALEERLMLQLEYDQRREHKRDHERLLDEVRQIMDTVEHEAGFDQDLFTSRLSAWFAEHFRTHDARFQVRLPGAR